MFAQLRRVVYLLVLLQCCACVAYAESAEEDALTTKMKVKLRELNITAEQLLANGGIVFSLLDANVQELQNLSEEVVGFVAEATSQLVQKRSKPVSSDSEDEGYENPTDEMVRHIKDMIKAVAGKAEIVRLAIGYCNHWSDIFDKVTTDCGKPTCPHMSSESDVDFLDMEPKATYEYLYRLRARISAATKLGTDTMEKVQEHEKVVEDALVRLKVLNETLKKSFEEIREDAKKTSAASFKKKIKEEVDTMVVKSAKEYEETADQISNKDQSRENSIIAKEVPQQPPAASLPVEQSTKSQAPAPEQSSAESQAEGQAESPAPKETSSLESEGTPNADVPTDMTANTTETDNSDAATPTATPTAAPTTTTTTTTAPIEANKKGLQNAASGPMSSNAVLTVLALTVSTVIGMTVV